MNAVLRPPWPAVGVAACILVAAIALLFAWGWSPDGGTDHRRARCRSRRDCSDRTACLRDGRCGFGGRLRLAVQIPGSTGGWTHLHVRLHDATGDLGDRITSWPIRDRVAYPDVQGLAEGVWRVEFHASTRASPDAACAGDLWLSTEVRVAGSLARLAGDTRGNRGALQLARAVKTPPCRDASPQPPSGRTGVGAGTRAP